MSTRLLVSNIPHMVSEEEFRRLFSQLEGCLDCRLTHYADSQGSGGSSGIVDFASYELASMALSMYNAWNGWGSPGLNIAIMPASEGLALGGPADPRKRPRTDTGPDAPYGSGAGYGLSAAAPPSGGGGGYGLSAAGGGAAGGGGGGGGGYGLSAPPPADPRAGGAPYDGYDGPPPTHYGGGPPLPYGGGEHHAHGPPPPHMHGGPPPGNHPHGHPGPPPPHNMPPLPPDASPTLFVDGLPPDCSLRETRHIFRPFAGFQGVRVVVKDSKIIQNDTVTLTFIEFANPMTAFHCLLTLQGYPVDTDQPDRYNLKLSFAKETRDARRGGRVDETGRGRSHGGSRGRGR